MPIALGTSATIGHVEQFRSAMLESFMNGGPVELDASDVAEADLSFVQLVEAARIHAEARGATFCLTAPANEAVRAVLERGGFCDAAAPDFNTFWFHGEMTQ